MDARAGDEDFTATGNTTSCIRAEAPSAERSDDGGVVHS
jgi:hypothetical protein